MLRLVLVLFVTVVGVNSVLGQRPSPCITPPLFTSKGAQLDYTKGQLNRYFIAYDAHNKRRAIIEEQKAGFPGREYFELLVLAKENTVYQINLSKKTCSKSTLPRPWRPYGIPRNATFVNEYTLGGPGEILFAQEWANRLPFGQREAEIVVVSLNNCYPISQTTIVDFTKPNTSISTNFYDITEGISDPDVFIPPEECRNAQWVKSSDIKGALFYV